jgi:hypothetical protein
MKSFRERCEDTVDGIIGDLSDRQGLDWAWEGIDEDIQIEIREEWVQLVYQNLVHRDRSEEKEQ